MPSTVRALALLFFCLVLSRWIAVPALGSQTVTVTATATVKPMLLRRGSSHLAIGQTGTAVVRVRIGADGTPQDAHVVSTTNRRLVPGAIETALSSLYTPAMRNGRPFTCDYLATFHFDGSGS